MKILVISDYSPREAQGIAVTLREVVEAFWQRYQDKGDIRVRVHACEGAEELAQSKVITRPSKAGENIHVQPYTHPAREFYRTPHASETNWYNDESLVSLPYPHVAPTAELKESLQQKWEETSSDEPGPDVIHWLLPSGNIHVVSCHVLPNTPVYISHQVDTNGCLGPLDGSALHGRFSPIFGSHKYFWSPWAERSFIKYGGQLGMARIAQDWPGGVNAGPYTGFLEEKELWDLRRKLVRPCYRFVSRPEDVVVPTAVKNEFVQGRSYKVVDRRAGYRKSLVQEICRSDLFYEGSRTIKRDPLGQDLENKVLILMVNRLSREKNLALAINAFNMSPQLKRTAHLVIIGNGPGTHEEQLLAMIQEADSDADSKQELSVKNCITFLGRRPNGDVPRYYQGCDVFLTTSVAESFGLTVAEALCCDTPTLMSDNVLAFQKMYGSEEFLRRYMFDNQDVASLQERLQTVVTLLTSDSTAGEDNANLGAVIERNGLWLRQQARIATNNLMSRGVFYASWKDAVSELVNQYEYAIAYKRSTRDWKNGHSKVDYIRGAVLSALTFIPRNICGRPAPRAMPSPKALPTDTDSTSTEILSIASKGHLSDSIDGENSPLNIDAHSMFDEKAGEHIVRNI